MDCPYPLVFYPDYFSPANPSAACQIECPIYVFGGEDEFWGTAAAMYVTSVPSMLCSLVMVITWALNPSKRYLRRHGVRLPANVNSFLVSSISRRYPAILIMWLALSALGGSTVLNLGVLVGGPERTICTWDDTPIGVSMDNADDNDGQGVMCIIQAIGHYYFGLAVNFWWFASA